MIVVITIIGLIEKNKMTILINNLIQSIIIVDFSYFIYLNKCLKHMLMLYID